MTISQTRWANSFDWEYWLASAKELERDHPTLDRNYSRSKKPEALPYIASKDSDLGTQGLKILEQLRHKIRRRHYSIRIEQSYETWIGRYIGFHKGQSPEKLGRPEVVSFLEYLSVIRDVSISTQNQALNALMFLYSRVLKRPFGDLGEFARPKRPRKLPVVLSRSEVARLLEGMEEGTFGLHDKGSVASTDC